MTDTWSIDGGMECMQIRRNRYARGGTVDYYVVLSTDWKQEKVIVYMYMLYGCRSLSRRRVVNGSLVRWSRILSFTAPPRRCYVDQPYNDSTHYSSQILDEGIRASFSILNVRNVSTFLVSEEKNGIPQSTVSCNGRTVLCEPGRSWLYLSFNFANAFISCFI